LKPKSLIVLVLLATLVLLACNFPRLAESVKANTDTPTVPPSQEQINNQPANQDLGTPAPPTSSPDLTGFACLVGNWTIDDFSPYVLSALPQDMVQQYQISYNDMSGHALLTFNEDKTMTLQAEQLQIHFSGKLSFVKVPVTLSVDGPATGYYQADDSNLSTENVDTNKMQASVRAMGQNLVDPPTLISAIPLLGPPTNQAKYTCSGDILQLRILAYPDNVPSMVFHRVK
jgi:hypothetical protein